MVQSPFAKAQPGANAQAPRHVAHARAPPWPVRPGQEQLKDLPQAIS